MTLNTLSEKEQRELVSDPTLMGNRIAAAIAALGIPPCSGCKRRQAWLNRAHKWLRKHYKK